MELLIIVLNKTEYLTEILDGFIDEGIKGATVLDSSGMGRIVADHIPFLSQLFSLDDTDENNSKTIFTVVNSSLERDRAVNIVERVIGDTTKPDSVFYFSVPVLFAKGLSEAKHGDKA